MAKRIVKEVIEGSHFVDDDGSEDKKIKEPSWHKRSSRLHQRVARVGENVLQAARDEIRISIKALPPRSADSSAQVEAEREALEAAQERLRGTWHWVVTNSDAINAFVTPYCPRRVFVCEGLVKKLKPTDDELAFIMSHELSHVIHAHGHQAIDESAALSTLQLMVFGLVDPTGLLAFAVSGVTSLWMLAREKRHSREHESEADESGLAICHRACYDKAGGASAMEKLRAASGNESKRHASWLDTHPAESDRIEALVAQAASSERWAHTLEGEGAVNCAAKKRTLWQSIGLR